MLQWRKQLQWCGNENLTWSIIGVCLHRKRDWIGSQWNVTNIRSRSRGWRWPRLEMRMWTLSIGQRPQRQWQRQGTREKRTRMETRTRSRSLSGFNTADKKMLCPLFPFSRSRKVVMQATMQSLAMQSTGNKNQQFPTKFPAFLCSQIQIHNQKINPTKKNFEPHGW